MEEKSNVLIVLPTYNEEEAIEKVLKDTLKLQLTTIVIDAGSSDRTVELVKKNDVPVYDRKEYGKGYGCAILKALDVAQKEGFEWILILDSDLTYPPESIPDLIAASTGFDLIIGVRNMKDIGLMRRLANQIHCLFASLLFKKSILDINSGMRMIKVDKFKGHLTELNMGMVPQISSFAMRNNYKIKEIQIPYYPRVGDSKSDFLDVVVILWCILRERVKRKVSV